MTAYVFHSAGWRRGENDNRAGATAPPRQIVLRVGVGARGRLEEIPLTEFQAAELVEQLARCLRQEIAARVADSERRNEAPR